MDSHTIAQQALIEHRILQHVKAALRLSLDWKVNEVGFHRKLSSVRFTAQSLQRHIERMMCLEEDGGYMDAVRQEKPDFAAKVQALEQEHGEIRRLMAQVMPQLEGDSPHDPDRLNDACESLERLLATLDSHDQRETDLLLEVFSSDVGGEG